MGGLNDLFDEIGGLMDDFLNGGWYILVIIMIIIAVVVGLYMIFRAVL